MEKAVPYQGGVFVLRSSYATENGCPTISIGFVLKEMLVG